MKSLTLASVLLASLIQSASASTIECFLADPNKSVYHNYSEDGGYGGTIMLTYDSNGAGTANYSWGSSTPGQNQIPLGLVSVSPTYIAGELAVRVTGNAISGSITFFYEDWTRYANFSFVDETGSTSEKRMLGCIAGPGVRYGN